MAGVKKRPWFLEKLVSHAHAFQSPFRVKQADAPFLRGGDYSELGQFDFIMA